MPNQNTNLLSATELLDFYGLPILNDTERKEYFTFNSEELKALRQFKNIEYAIYFAICLVFLKIKHTLIDFNYQNITLERQHIMERYFPSHTFPKSIPKDYNVIAQIENKVLALCGYKRFTGEIIKTIKTKLQQSAPIYPRQRQLCKALLDLFVTHHVVIPKCSTIQNIVSETWNKENERITKVTLRHTTKHQRKIILSLLNKTDKLYRIVSIKQEIKGFNTIELNKEIKKIYQLQPVFEIAKNIIPKLQLPMTTINYYANLINYYNGPKLKQINQQSIQLYLLCYCFTRYQMLNDNLLEALKKRTLDYKNDAIEYAKNQILTYLESIKEIRGKVSDLLISIKNHPNPHHIPRKDIYNYIAEDELLVAADLLVNEKFDKQSLFWLYIDSMEKSIKINLRKLFLTIDFVITNNESLKEVVSYTKTNLINNTFYDMPFPNYIKSWINKKHYEHIIKNDNIVHNRFEFLLYMQIVHHISTNKLTLKYSIKHKKVEDDLIEINKWHKEKLKILKTFAYPKLKTPIQQILKNKKLELFEFYKIVNADILNGKNKQIKITQDKTGNKIWRLRSLEPEPELNNNVFINFQQRNIVDVMQFVNSKTNFIQKFESILPRSTKGKRNQELIMAVVLANAIRIGTRKMAAISDLNESALLTAEAAYVRTETLTLVIDTINNAAVELPIFKEWHINSILHASLDGMKLETSLRNIKARHSSKYFGQGVGVSAFNEIFNYFPLASRLIGTNEYEGNYAFEMVMHQNTSNLKPNYISTDKHGMNSLNFGLFDLVDMFHAPRIPKPHREILWGFGNVKDYKDFIIKPTRFINENFLLQEWDNIQRFVASLLSGEVAAPNILIRKLSSNNYNSDTKKAFAQYNHIIRSRFLLQYIHDPEFRRAILIALNRGEAYNKLYRAITILRKGELRGQNEIEIEIWNQCTRLISSVILYYNTYILNKFYQKTKDNNEKILCEISPSAWIHVNMLGYYQFFGESSDDLIENSINVWDGIKQVKNVEKN